MFLLTVELGPERPNGYSFAPIGSTIAELNRSKTYFWHDPNATPAGGLGLGVRQHWGRDDQTLLDDVPKLALTAAMLAIATLALAAAILFSPPVRWPGPATVAAVGVLGAPCTAAAYVMYLTLIERAGVIRARIVAYVNPVVAALLGVALLHESLGAGAYAGMLLLIAGSWLSAGGSLAGRRRLLAPALPAALRSESASLVVSDRHPGSD